MRLFGDVASRVEDPHFAHALALAASARGRTAPNPLVGCVVIRDGRVVGEGFHPAAGEPHAEVFALRDAGEQARGAHLFVTLEPCSHHGRTPPCTEAILEAGVSAVSIGMSDPSELAGGGAAFLRSHGVAVSFAHDPAPFAELNGGWLKRLATGLPRIVVKTALSLDGHPGLVAGERAAITGDSGARVTRTLREWSDAVVVGASTVDADDPALTVRDADGVPGSSQPLRVVLVRSKLPDPSARVFADGAASTVALVPEEMSEVAREQLGSHVGVLTYDSASGVAGAWSSLGELGLNEVLVEAGPSLMTSIWNERAFDELVTVTAGGMAGDGAPSLFGGGATNDGGALFHAVQPAETGIVGDVVATVWRPASTF